MAVEARKKEETKWEFFKMQKLLSPCLSPSNFYSEKKKITNGADLIAWIHTIYSKTNLSLLKNQQMVPISKTNKIYSKRE